jgi:hypothetical protein
VRGTTALCALKGEKVCGVWGWVWVGWEEPKPCLSQASSAGGHTRELSRALSTSCWLPSQEPTMPA